MDTNKETDWLPPDPGKQNTLPLSPLEMLPGDIRMAHLAAIVESSGDAIISKTLEGIITSWNNAAELIFGYTAQEAIGQPITMLIPHSRLQEEPAILERLKKGERVDHFETIRITKSGRLLHVSLTISPIKDSTGKIVGASKVARDITAQKEAERIIKENEEEFRMELERQVEERTAALKRANEELEQYAYIASHDLQEPLRKIQTFAELLKENLHDAAAVEKYYEKINASARRMSTLIRDVLNYSRLSQVETLHEIVYLDEVWRDVKMDFELLIAQKQAALTAGPLPVIRGDGQQLRQLFGNLLSNSLKFCERKPEIHLSAQVMKGPLPGGVTASPVRPYVKILFKDNGIGFEQKYAEQIFVAFKRLNNRQLYSGTGIGMALCKKIVERHNGVIRADSEPGKGTVFTILLPVG